MKTSNQSKSIKALAIGVIAALGIGIAGSASAATPWQRDEMRREEVRRAQIHHFHQDQRINRLERTGRITPWQARQMHRDVHGRGYYDHGYYRR